MSGKDELSIVRVQSGAVKHIHEFSYQHWVKIGPQFIYHYCISVLKDIKPGSTYAEQALCPIRFCLQWK